MIQILDEKFGTKKGLVERIRAIISKYGDGEPLEGADLGFVLALLDRHPRSASKVGCGVSSVGVSRDSTSGRNRGFFLTREDGTVTDFSFLKCADGSDRSTRRKFRMAARNAVRGQILSFRERWFAGNADAEGTVACPVSGIRIRREGSHVDHHPVPFESLVRSFLEREGISEDGVPFEEGSDGDEGVRFADSSVSERFAEYHAGNASLRVVSEGANLRKPR